MNMSVEQQRALFNGVHMQPPGASQFYPYVRFSIILQFLVKIISQFIFDCMGQICQIVFEEKALVDLANCLVCKWRIKYIVKLYFCDKMMQDLENLDDFKT